MYGSDGGENGPLRASVWMAFFGEYTHSFDKFMDYLDHISNYAENIQAIMGVPPEKQAFPGDFAYAGGNLVQMGIFNCRCKS